MAEVAEGQHDLTPAASGAPAPGALPDLPRAFAALLLCQLAGEVAVRALGLLVPGLVFPGPVLGMVLLFGLLVWRKGPDAGLDAAAGGLLRHLALLFVPAAVGIVRYGGLLAEHGLALALALLVSTVLTLVVTVAVFLAVSRWTGRADGG